MGAGPAGLAHARGYAGAGGYKVEGVCDLIPARVAAFRKEFPAAREYESAEAMIKDPGLDVLSICLPTHLHAEWGLKALRKGKHVVVESPPAIDVKGMRAMLRAAEKSGTVLLPAFQRHWGGHEMAARQAVEKGAIGTPLQARAAWHRGWGTSGIPQGTRGIGEATGWYTDPAKSGGGALIDLGLHLLEVGWSLLGYPAPEAALAATQSMLAKLPVEESAVGILRFAGGRVLELSVGWAAKLPPAQYGVSCRVSGESGALDVYTAQGATVYRGDEKKVKSAALNPPKVTHHSAMMRELKSLATLAPEAGDKLALARRAVTLMRMIEALYKSAATGKSAEVKAD